MARRKKDVRRWTREVKAIALLVIAGFALVALATFDPTQPRHQQHAPVGPVGVWLGWALFATLGYAGFLLPLMLSVIGASIFMRPLVARGWPPVVGVTLLLLSASGLLAQIFDDRTGGIVGWAVARGLRAEVGSLGAWLMLLGGMPIGVLFVTQISFATISRAVGARLERWRRLRAIVPATAAEPSAMTSPGAGPEMPAAMPPPPLPVVVEPKRRPVAAGLAWQETFDFGKDGTRAFQLPPLGLLRTPEVSEQKLTREALQDNAETLRRKLQDFEVEGRIVQVSPGPVITSYEFEPAAGVKISRVVNLADDLALALKAASVRIVGPIPGRGTVAIEVPNAEPALVYLREIFASPDFAESKRKIPLALGKAVTGGAVALPSPAG
jgi:S-DNA-T family DNA segregation ATPase FtsK/SpoIIIE